MSRILTSAQALERIANDDPQEYRKKGNDRLFAGGFLTAASSLTLQAFYQSRMDELLNEWSTNWKSAAAKAFFMGAVAYKELRLIDQGFEYLDFAKAANDPNAPIYRTESNRLTRNPLSSEQTGSRIVTPHERIDLAFESKTLSFVNGVTARGNPGYGQEDSFLTLWYTIEGQSQAINARGSVLRGLSMGEDQSIWVLGEQKGDDFYVHDAADAITSEFDPWNVKKRPKAEQGKFSWLPARS